MKSRFSEEQIIEIVREGDGGNLQVPAPDRDAARLRYFRARRIGFLWQSSS